MQSHFSGKVKETLKLPKTFPPLFEFSINLSWKSAKSLIRNLWTVEHWFKSLKCQIWLTNTKPFFLEKRDRRWNSRKNFSPCIFLFYKFVLKSVSSLNQLVWATEYWFKALKVQICFTNTKLLFQESEANIETF